MSNDFYHQAIIRSGCKIPSSYIYEKLKKHGYECDILPRSNNSVVISWFYKEFNTEVEYVYSWKYDVESEFDKIINDVISVFSKAKQSKENEILMDEALE